MANWLLADPTGMASRVTQVVDAVDKSHGEALRRYGTSHHEADLISLPRQRNGHCCAIAAGVASPLVPVKGAGLVDRRRRSSNTLPLPVG